MGGVFINYRGRDSGIHAVLVYQALCEHLPADEVFLDNQSIPTGADAAETLLDRVRRCGILLALIGPDWLTASDQAGRRLIDRPADWVRRELVAAFAAGVLVIPVLVGDVERLREADLPDEIAQLGRLQYRRLRYRRWAADLAAISGDVRAQWSPPGAVVAREVSAPAAPGASASWAGELARWKRYPVGIDHDRLLGAADTVARIVELAGSQTAAPALTVSGDGGRGKTAVTFEAVDALALAKAFTRVVWASARTATFQTGLSASDQIGTVDWLHVVQEVAEQLGCERGPVRGLWEDELRDRIRGFGEHERVLLVVDNLEGVDDAERVLDRVRDLGLGRPHKLVATTRWAVSGNDYGVPDVPVRPLSETDSTRLARLIGRGNAEIEAVDDIGLAPIYAITEGNPFLIKLIVRRFLAGGRPLEEVIRELTCSSRRPAGPQPLGARVRRYLYEQSLEELAVRFDPPAAAALMASFCFASRGSAVRYEDLLELTGIADEGTFRDLLDTACGLALVRPTNRHREYSIHSLLYEFTCSAPSRSAQRRPESTR